VVKSCVRRIEMANLLSTRKGDWILRLNKTSEFLGVDPSCALSVATDGTVSGLTHGAHRMFSSVLNEDWRMANFIGRSFEDLFALDYNDLPCLLNAVTPGEQALETRDGKILYADVRAPVRLPSRSVASTVPKALTRIHGGDPALSVVVEKAARIVDKQISIVLVGETGVGKEFVAQALHEARKKQGAFVAINCAALPEALIESELFGYVANSFTGANAKGKKGLIEQANGGTLFLDEVGDMPLVLQARLLRVLAEREVMPVGATRPIQVDIRVIAASHRNLKDMVDAGLFRQDLYYRLNGVVLSLPALRNRKDKSWLIGKVGKKVAGEASMRFTKEALEVLRGYDWPGNIREMINVFELCHALSEGGPIGVGDLPESLVGGFERLSSP
jgi:sigma-54 dependent transcriptional regulator, acetoin dehydrogenase operon transcriptional activator AcoR